MLWFTDHSGCSSIFLLSSDFGIMVDRNATNDLEDIILPQTMLYIELVFGLEFQALITVASS